MRIESSFMKIPKVVYDIPPVTKFNLTEKCGTCAYHTECSPDEDEMTKWYWAEHPLPHQCHERSNGYACVGAMESAKRLGLIIENRKQDMALIEFWILVSRCTGIAVSYLSEDSAAEHLQGNEEMYHVREVNPAYDELLKEGKEIIRYFSDCLNKGASSVAHHEALARLWIKNIETFTEGDENRKQALNGTRKSNSHSCSSINCKRM